MELLETQDPEKKKLIETSDRHRRELEKEVEQISERTQKMVTNALIIGGSLALTYFIVSRLSGGSSKNSKQKKVRQVPVIVKTDDDEDDEVEVVQEEKHSLAGIIAPQIIAQVGTQIVNQVTLMLLSMAREKLSEFMHSGKDKKDENS